jgi:hypothetical protein
VGDRAVGGKLGCESVMQSEMCVWVDWDGCVREGWVVMDGYIPVTLPLGCIFVFNFFFS